jgi:hypothetical protein
MQAFFSSKRRHKHPGQDRAMPGTARRGGSRFAATATLLGLALFGCAHSRQQVVSSGLPSRHAARSEQVVVLSDDPLPPGVVEELEHTRALVTESLGIPPGKRDVVVYLFRDQARYAAYMRENYPNLPARRAFFIGTPKELAVYAHWGDHAMVDLRHEYTHGLLHASVGHVPLWLDEGIAEYFEVGGAEPGTANGEHLGRLAAALRTGWRPNVHRLEQLEAVADMSREDYQEAWGWVHYLMHEAPHGQEILSEYLNELRHGQTPVAISQQIRREIPDAEIQLARHLERMSRGTATHSGFTSIGQSPLY